MQSLCFGGTDAARLVDLEELDLKDERRVGGNHAGDLLRAIGKVGRARHARLLSERELQDALVPALDDAADADGRLERRAASSPPASTSAHERVVSPSRSVHVPVDRAVKLLSVQQRARVVHPVRRATSAIVVVLQFVLVTGLTTRRHPSWGTASGPLLSALHDSLSRLHPRTEQHSGRC